MNNLFDSYIPEVWEDAVEAIMPPDSPLSERLHSPDHNLIAETNSNPKSASEMQSNIDSDVNSNYDSEASDNMPLPPEDRFSSEQELQDMIQEWAARHGFAFTKRRSRQCNQAGRRKVVWYCDRKGEAPEILRYNGGQPRKRRTSSRCAGCEFSINAIQVGDHWEIRYRPESRFHHHSHPRSISSWSHPTHRRLTKADQVTLRNLHDAGKGKRVVIKIGAN
jgi:hypothetical protein